MIVVHDVHVDLKFYLVANFYFSYTHPEAASRCGEDVEAWQYVG